MKYFLHEIKMAKKFYLYYLPQKKYNFNSFLWSRNPGIDLLPIPGFGIGQKGRDHGIAIPTHKYREVRSKTRLWLLGWNEYDQIWVNWYIHWTERITIRVGTSQLGAEEPRWIRVFCRCWKLNVKMILRSERKCYVDWVKQCVFKASVKGGMESFPFMIEWSC